MDICRIWFFYEGDDLGAMSAQELEHFLLISNSLRSSRCRSLSHVQPRSLGSWLWKRPTQWLARGNGLLRCAATRRRSSNTARLRVESVWMLLPAASLCPMYPARSAASHGPFGGWRSAASVCVVKQLWDWHVEASAEERHVFPYDCA